jgi:hypothetical protein
MWESVGATLGASTFLLRKTEVVGANPSSSFFSERGWDVWSCGRHFVTMRQSPRDSQTLVLGATKTRGHLAMTGDSFGNHNLREKCSWHGWGSGGY